MLADQTGNCVSWLAGYPYDALDVKVAREARANQYPRLAGQIKEQNA